ncbi:MAG: type 1 glutamine amidotransferase domain-containing protein [Myxococcaceae bacterium]
MPSLPSVLILVTSHDALGSSDKKTGYWLGEVTHFHHALAQAGFAVDIASPKGGRPPMDEKSRSPRDPLNEAFLANEALLAKLDNALAASAVDEARYQAVYFAGGHGAMWDFPNNPTLSAIASALYCRGGVVSAVCHGAAGLLGVVDGAGKPVLQGRRVTGFANLEERLIGLTQVVPFLLEDKLKQAGGLYHRAFFPFAPHVEEDSLLVTGQNPASAGAVGKRVARLLAARDAPRSRVSQG